MKVVHVCPTYFGAESIIAGGERYSYDLAKAMSKRVPTTLVTFGRRSFVREDDGLTVKCFKKSFYVKGNKTNPFSLWYLWDLVRADVIHCHQFRTVITDMTILLGMVLRKRIYVTDLGGAADFSLSYRLPLWKGIQRLLLISNFNRDLYHHLPVEAESIYGGVDTERFVPGHRKKLQRVLHVGRILRYKGIHMILDALPDGVGLDIVGQVYDEVYFRELQGMIQGRDVVFYTEMSDEELIDRYQLSLVTVLAPTFDSGFTTAMESLACGTPVIATTVGSLPEIVDDGVTGFLVPPDDAHALHQRISWCVQRPEDTLAMGMRGRESVLKEYTWDRVVDRCLTAYGR